MLALPLLIQILVVGFVLVVACVVGGDKDLSVSGILCQEEHDAEYVGVFFFLSLRLTWDNFCVFVNRLLLLYLQ